MAELHVDFETRSAVVCGDALANVSTLGEASVAAVICDPPYGVTQNVWDQGLDWEALWPELLRVTEPDGNIVLTAKQPFTSQLVMSNMKHFRHEIIWRKNKASGHLNCKRRPLQNHESILIFSKSGNAFYDPQFTEGHRPGNYAKRTTHSTNYGCQKSTTYGGSTFRHPLSVQEFDVLNNDDSSRVHPTQKPVEMFRWLVRAFCRPGGTVLDFCAGSGTTGVAAKLEGRSSILVEMDPAMAIVAEIRMSRDV